MRRIVIPAIAVLSLAACGSSAASSAGSGPASGGSSSGSAPSPVPASAGCGPSGAHTLAGDAGARVYSSGGVVYGCARGSGRRVTLGHAGSCVRSDSVGPAAVAGRLAAYGLTQCGIDTGSATVIVRRLSDGAILFRDPAANEIGPEGYVQVTDVVVTPRGATAWIARSSSIVRRNRATSVAVRRGAGAVVVATGATISPTSLRVAKGRVSWTQRGARHSTAL